MLIAEEKKKSKAVKKTSDRREHLKLSLEERRRQLSGQADKLVSHYEKTKRERESWQGGDISDF